ncbi:hypothetical protein [Nocardia sp. MW-W600-9]
MKPDHAAQFDALIARAAKVRTMDFDSAGREAYEAANEALVQGVDRMIAVWDSQDGQRAGTGTVVELARSTILGRHHMARRRSEGINRSTKSPVPTSWLPS